MLNITNEIEAPPGQVITVPKGDRWRIHHRLQELMIPSRCTTDGSLRVEINHAVELLLVHSIHRQFTATRQELVDWLEQCWQVQLS
jgi:hypothetical protein